MISCSFPVTVPLHHVINLFRTVWFDNILQLNKTKPGYSILQNKSSTEQQLKFTQNLKSPTTTQSSATLQAKSTKSGRVKLQLWVQIEMMQSCMCVLPVSKMPTLIYTVNGRAERSCKELWVIILNFIQILFNLRDVKVVF
jgi:hypothetical protein